MDLDPRPVTSTCYTSLCLSFLICKTKRVILLVRFLRRLNNIYKALSRVPIIYEQSILPILHTLKIYIYLYKFNITIWEERNVKGYSYLFIYFNDILVPSEVSYHIFHPSDLKFEKIFKNF